MNQGFVKLLAERGDEVKQFLTGINEFRSELREKVKALEALVDVGDYRNVEQLPWSPNPYVSPMHFLQHRIHVDEKSYIVVQPAILPIGWKIEIFSRGPRDCSELQGLPDEIEIPSEKNGRFVHPMRFDYEEYLSRVAAAVQKIVDKLSTSLG